MEIRYSFMLRLFWAVLNSSRYPLGKKLSDVQYIGVLEAAVAKRKTTFVCSSVHFHLETFCTENEFNRAIRYCEVCLAGKVLYNDITYSWSAIQNVDHSGASARYTCIFYFLHVWNVCVRSEILYCFCVTLLC